MLTCLNEVVFRRVCFRRNPPKANVNVDFRLSTFVVTFLTGMPDPHQTGYVTVLELLVGGQTKKRFQPMTLQT